MLRTEHTDLELNGDKAGKSSIEEKEIYEEIGIANLKTIFLTDE